MPSYIVFDRNYMHTNSKSSVLRAAYLDVNYVAVVDSDCREIHESGMDTQCFGASQGPGPYLFQNNYLEAAGENIMFGGSDPVITGAIPSDITVVGNLFNKQTSWANQSAPYNWTVKNLFETKNVQRLLIDGNVFQNTWAAAQWEAIIIRSVNQSGACTWCSSLDITVTNNLIQHAPTGIVLSPILATSNPSAPTGRVLVQNNLMLDIACTEDGVSGGHGLGFQLAVEPSPYIMHDIVLDHNTVLNDPTACGLSGAFYIGQDTGSANHMTNFQLTNSIFNYGNYGMLGDSCAVGTCSLSTYASGYVYNDVVFMNGAGTAAGGTWPAGTLWNTLAGVGFTSYSGTNPNLTGNFQLTSGPYLNAGTDGKDIGVWDWPVFNVKTTNARNGIFLP
jgi:hypothetical protein